MHSSTESILPPALPAALPLQGQYPVIRDDAAQMCALQMQAEHGPTLAEDGAGFEAALEKYMVKQVRYCRQYGRQYNLRARMLLFFCLPHALFAHTLCQPACMPAQPLVPPVPHPLTALPPRRS